MKINIVVNALVLSITIFAVEGIYAQDSFLLACKGKQWIETESQKFNITEYTVNPPGVLVCTSFIISG